MRGVTGNRGNTDQRAPMQVLMTSLGSRDLEALAQFGHDGPHHRTLFLQRVDVAEQHVQFQSPHVHGKDPPEKRGAEPPVKWPRTPVRTLGARLLAHLERLDDVLELEIAVVAERETTLE